MYATLLDSKKAFKCKIRVSNSFLACHSKLMLLVLLHLPLPCIDHRAVKSISCAKQNSSYCCLLNELFHAFPSGWDATTQTTVACRIGTYNEGWGLVGCTPCKEGYTTPTTGAPDESSCVVAPGFFVDLVRSPNGPILCDEGEYCLGFNVTEARSCPPSTWSLRGATTSEDCGGKGAARDMG
jgi:hypothetical protein